MLSKKQLHTWKMEYCSSDQNNFYMVIKLLSIHCEAFRQFIILSIANSEYQNVTSSIYFSIFNGKSIGIGNLLCLKQFKNWHATKPKHIRQCSFESLYLYMYRNIFQQTTEKMNSVNTLSQKLETDAQPIICK